MRRSGVSSLCCDWSCQYLRVNVRLGSVCVCKRESVIWEKVVTGQEDRGQHPAHLNI